ncbi:FecR family protein [Chitinophaga arvensicola]|uniref:FecR protein n=1 Tax=Chitinophaga arvensicola TaxID=29529 RepID=A0A1I0SA27_9BACT|nr:FecR family protein [Chitinophaga arvensicola]SEW52999.1 FecR protein [Chitinophaga arvensicola]
MSSTERLEVLFDRYVRRECTPGEVTELVLLMQDPAAEEILTPAMMALWERIRKEETTYPVNWEQMYASVTSVEDVQEPLPQIRWWRPMAAAVVILLAAAGSYLLFISRKTAKENTTMPVAMQDASPGGNRAVLTLGNGDTIVVNAHQNGWTAQEGSSSVVKKDSNTLVYETTGKNTATTVAYHILTTPRGGQFRVVLPDGSRVWLNAGSSVRYPVAFNGTRREVTLTGEAYFEVAADARMPFRVTAGAVVMDDLGTAFNVMAYPDEAQLKTTLVEGAVKVQRKEEAVILKPGQQVAAGQELKVQTVDTDEVIAWKNGEFSFNHNSIYEIMRQIARWYEVEVKFEGQHDTYLSGNISRSANLSEVLRMLELAGDVKFVMKDGQVTVIKK